MFGNALVLISCLTAAFFSMTSLIMVLLLRFAMHKAQQNQEKHWEQMVTMLKHSQEQVECITTKLKEGEQLIEIQSKPSLRTPSKAEEALRIKLTELLKL